MCDNGRIDEWERAKTRRNKTLRFIFLVFIPLALLTRTFRFMRPVPSRIFGFHSYCIIIPILWYKFHSKWKWNTFYVLRCLLAVCCSTLHSLGYGYFHLDIPTQTQTCTVYGENFDIFLWFFVCAWCTAIWHILVLLSEPNYYSFNIYRFIACFWFARGLSSNTHWPLIKTILYNNRIQRENSTFTHTHTHTNWLGLVSLTEVAEWIFCGFISKSLSLIFSYWQLVPKNTPLAWLFSVATGIWCN